MPSYHAVNRTEFAARRWARVEDYYFAAEDAVAPLAVQELPKACQSLPIGFIKHDGGYVPVAVQGLAIGQNLFVVKGRWIAPYMPELYRAYPFTLAPGEVDLMHLCIDMDSGQVGDACDLPFFDNVGNPAPEVREMLDILERLHRNRTATRRVCAALAAEGLFMPWPLQVQGDQRLQAIEGLFRIDEARLNRLDATALQRVHAAGGLPVAYCQLLSMVNIQTLGLISRKLDEIKNKPSAAANNEVDIDGFFKREGITDPAFVSKDSDDLLMSIPSEDGDFDLTTVQPATSKHN
jgi:hypothetical protein